MLPVHQQSYGIRASTHNNTAAKKLLQTMELKKSNLAIGVDVTNSEDVLKIVDAIGPYVCLVKTHIDIIEDFTPSLIEKLQDLSLKHNFMFFEDRKFADIGNTVSLQYSSGVHKIASWAHITNAHAVPGPSVVTGLAQIGLPLGRGLLLIAEMSTQGSLAKGAYTDDAIQMAREHREFVIGFVAQQRFEAPDIPGEDFLILTPGVGLDSQSDGKGQQYRTPREVIFESRCDVIAVGRGIYGDGKDLGRMRAQAQRYQKAGWQAYLERIGEASHN